MKFALVGVGGAGGRIVNALAKVEKESDRAFTRGQHLVFDTTQEAFTEFTDISPDKHVLVGDTHPDIRGEGLDGDIELGAEVAREDTDEIFREFDKLATHEVHATLFVAGLGGGTGGGVGPVILQGLQSITDSPVYVLGILPDDSESDRAAYNAARSLRSYVELADNTLLFDNDAWYDDRADGELEDTYQRLNVELVTRVIAVLAAGELENAPIAENRMDASDIMRTLAPGGVSTLGYATTELDRPEGLWERLLALFRSTEEEGPVTDATQIKELIQSTVQTKMTLPSDITSTEKGMLVLSGPRDVCSRKGFETGRYWLEQETDTVEVRAGDEPMDGSLIAASVLLTNVTEVPRIDELQERAVAYKNSLADDQSTPATATGAQEGAFDSPVEDAEAAAGDGTDSEEAAAADETGSEDEQPASADATEPDVAEDSVEETVAEVNTAIEDAEPGTDDPADSIEEAFADDDEATSDDGDGSHAEDESSAEDEWEPKIGTEEQIDSE
ncbi:MAG: cell division protein FtsZ [Halovenus sp.]